MPCIIPHFGKVAENRRETATGKPGTVFHEDVERSYVANNTGHVAPQAGAGAGQSAATAGTGDILTREAARNHVNKAVPGPSVESGDVVPDGEGREEAVALALHEDAAGVLFDLDGADGAPAVEQAAEYAAANAAEKCQLIH